MRNSIAHFFTFLLHPIFIPTYGYSLLLFTDNYYSFFFTTKIKFLLILISFSFTCVLPVINIFILNKLNLIKSIKVDDKSDRTLPYIITSLFYCGMIYMVWNFNIPSLFKSFIGAGAICILISALINTKWKISAHMTGIGGLSGLAIAVSVLFKQDFSGWIYLLIALSGILGFSRIQLKAHSPSQVYVGYVFGAIITFLFILVSNIVNLNYNL